MAKRRTSSKRTNRSTATAARKRQAALKTIEPDPEPEAPGLIAGLGRWWHGGDFRAKTDLVYQEDYDYEEDYDEEAYDEEDYDQEQDYSGEEKEEEVNEEVEEVHPATDDDFQKDFGDEVVHEQPETQVVAPRASRSSRSSAPKSQLAQRPSSSSNPPAAPRSKAPGASSRRSVPFLRREEAARAGVPAMYDDGIQWLKSGSRRHPAAVIVGLVFGWTGAWIAFWGAMAGASLGVLVGLGAGNVNIPVFRTFGVGQAASVVGVVSGLAVGAIGGFLIVFVFLVAHPLALIGSLVSGVIIATLLVVLVASFERLGLRMRGYRRLSRDEVRRVAPIVKSAADAMDLPGLPRFAIADQVIPNAWTHMRTVVLTAGLLQTLDDAELEAVLVHEFNHWRMGDAVGLRCVWAAAWPVVLLYNLGAVISGNTPKNKVGVRITVSSAFRWIIAWLIAWPAWVMTRGIIAPLTAAFQRRYEYEADAAASELGLGPALSSALTKIGAFETGRTGWEAAMTATHPPVELRVEALQAPRPDDWEYQEEELRGPSWGEVRRIFRGLATPMRH